MGMGDILQEYLTLLSVLFLSTIIVVGGVVRKRTRVKLPPSPRALPLIGHMHWLSPILHQAFQKLSNRYGPIVYILIGSNPCIIVSSPDIAKEILNTHETCFLNRPKTKNAEYLTYGSSDFALAPYGPHWKFLKKLCMTQLLNGPMLNNFRPIRQEEVKIFLNLLHKKGEAGEAINVGEVLSTLTNNIISRMALSKRCWETEDDAGEVRKIVKEMIGMLRKFNVSDSIWLLKRFNPQGFVPRLKDVRRRYDDLMSRFIKEHEDARKQVEDTNKVNDILDKLLEIYEDPNSQPQQVKLSRDNIKAFMMNMFGAGTDTSSVAMTWAMAELINHPDVAEKMREEMDKMIGKEERLVEESDIPNLPYLQAVVKETLRLHPTGPLIARESTEDCLISGFHIPAKTRVFVNVWALGRDPNHWDRPLEFLPQRFMEGESSSKLGFKGQQGFQFLPFGSGRRTCPGAGLAIQVLHTTLAAMVQCFEWKQLQLPNDSDSATLSMEEAPGTVLEKAHPILCLPVTRSNFFPLQLN